jgi:hypothetical protein
METEVNNTEKQEVTLMGKPKVGCCLVKILPSDLFKKEQDTNKLIVVGNKKAVMTTEEFIHHPYQAIVKSSAIEEINIGDRVALSRFMFANLQNYDQFIYEDNVFYLISRADIVFIYEAKN